MIHTLPVSTGKRATYRSNLLRVVLFCLFASGGFGKEICAVIWVNSGNDDATYYNYLVNTVAELNAVSTQYTYKLGSADYFGTVPYVAAGLGVTNDEFGNVNRARIFVSCHGIFDKSRSVFLNILVDKNRDAEGNILYSEVFPIQQMFAAGHLFYCGMDGNNGLITADDLGHAIEANYQSWGSPAILPPPEGDPNLIEVDDFTFTISAGVTKTVHGARNNITMKPGANCNIWGNDNFLTCGGNNFIAIWSNSVDTRISNILAGDIVNLGTNTTTTFNGPINGRGSFNVCGTNAWISADYMNAATIGGASFTLDGSFNNLAAADNNSIGLLDSRSHVGDNNVTLGANNGMAIWGVPNAFNSNTVNNLVAGNWVNLGSDTYTTFNGRGGYFGLCGTNVEVNASNQNTSSIPNAGFRINGDMNSIIANSGNTGHIWGQGNSLQLNGSDNILIWPIPGSPNTINNASLSDHVTIDAGTPGTDSTVNGGAGSLTLTGSEPSTLHTSNQQNVTLDRNLGTGTTTLNYTVYGDNNSETFATTGAGQLNVTNYGNSNYVNNTLVASGTQVTSAATYTAPQGGGGCMNSWLVTVTCYVISTGQIVWQRQYFVSDPIILNLAGERVKTQALASSLAHLDVQGTGIPNHAAWGVAGEGYLVYDSKDRNEVSSYSSLVAGAARLKGLTARGKRMLDRRDPLWNRLKVWVDADGTADARKAKLYTMDQLGIASIDIGGPKIVRVDNGNTITKEGIFTYTDGRKGCYAAANLPFEAAVKSSNEKTR